MVEAGEHSGEVIDDVTNEEEPRDLTDFFPANRSGFIERAGKVACVTTADLEDEHKRRHLESFQRSMTDWKAYEGRDELVEDSAKDFARRLLSFNIRTNEDLEVAIKKVRKELKCNPNKAQLGAALECLQDTSENAVALAKLLLRRAVRTSSGVAVITVLTSPGKFSCPHDCWYCPNEPGQPRSYLSTEPAVLRGNQCHWDAAIQFWDRARTLHRNRHTVDKVEVLVLGGTWSGYSNEYQIDFCRDLFFAANEFKNLMEAINYDAVDSRTDDLLKHVRGRKSLEEEQILNESASVKIIGLTLETRPDYITPAEIKKLRTFGCTRVQLGVQHIDSTILAGVNRGHAIEEVRRALHLLKSSCYKVDIHLMPDLPHSSPSIDQYMFDQVLRDCSLQADQWKIYPCEVTPFTKISEWYRDGIYSPYTEMSSWKPEGLPSDIYNRETTGEEVLIGLILQVKNCMHPWIRLNRVIRDIPNQSIIAGNSKTNLRQLLGVIAKQHGWTCPCMRCREVRQAEWNAQDAQLVIRAYRDADATEYFMSFENETRTTLYGFLRLRIPDFNLRNKSAHTRVLNCAFNDEDEKRMKNASSEDVEAISADFFAKYGSKEVDLPFECLKGRTALIRELHVYGVLVGTDENKNNQDGRTQHVGVGTALMHAAEVLACCKGAHRIVIIAGVGTRNYYKKFGYSLEQTYMTRDISDDEVMKQIFETWALKNHLIKESNNLKVEHVDLEDLPSLRNVKINYDIVHGVITGQKDDRVGSSSSTSKTPAAVSHRAFLSHWQEVISIPKMMADDENTIRKADSVAHKVVSEETVARSNEDDKHQIDAASEPVAAAPAEAAPIAPAEAAPQPREALPVPVAAPVPAEVAPTASEPIAPEGSPDHHPHPHKGEIAHLSEGLELPNSEKEEEGSSSSSSESEENVNLPWRPSSGSSEGQRLKKETVIVGSEKKAAHESPSSPVPHVVRPITVSRPNTPLARPRSDHLENEAAAASGSIKSALEHSRQHNESVKPEDGPDYFAANTRRTAASSGGPSLLRGWDVEPGTIGAVGLAALTFAIGIYFGRRTSR